MICFFVEDIRKQQLADFCNNHLVNQSPLEQAVLRTSARLSGSVYAPINVMPAEGEAGHRVGI